MTTKLLPRLIATGALAAALSGICAVTGLATSAHATPVVTQGTGGSIEVTLPYADVHAAAAGVDAAQTLCKSQILPAANALAPYSLRLDTCTQYIHTFSGALAYAKRSVEFTFPSNGQVTARTV
jgi:hypothetical protein